MDPLPFSQDMLNDIEYAINVDRSRRAAVSRIHRAGVRYGTRTHENGCGDIDCVTPMKFRFLDEICAEQGFPHPHVAALHPDANLVSCLVLQPGGTLSANGSSIRCTEAEHEGKCADFLRLATAKNSDLVVAPEYCCPWNEIARVVEPGSEGPGPGKLWILGCESITPADLQDIVQSCPDAHWIYDKSIHNASTGNFVDPVCLIYRSEDALPVVTVQFKSHPMGGVKSSTLERDNLIVSDCGYIVRNDENSIYLATLICSDALNFDPLQLPNAVHQPYLLVHVQLNAFPRKPAMTDYRNSLFRTGRSEQEVLCVNWSNEVSIAELGAFIIGTPQTALYTNSNDLDLKDSRIESNHVLGLHYVRWENRRASIFIATYDTHVFAFENTKPSQQLSDPTTRLRSGPNCKATYEWGDTGWDLSDQTDCGSAVTMESNNIASDHLLHQLSPMQLERFVCLTCGEVKQDVRKDDWHKPNELASLRVLDDEVVTRASFCRDADGHDKVNERFSKVETLIRLIEVQADDGDLVADLRGKKLGYDAKDPCINVFENQTPFGAAMFIGPCSNPAYLEQRYEEVSSIFGRSHARLYMAYTAGGAIHWYKRTRVPKTTDSGSAGPGFTNTRAR